MLKKIIVILFSLMAIKAFASIYVEEENGITRFSDTPGKNTRPMNLKNESIVTSTTSPSAKLPKAPVDSTPVKNTTAPETVKLQAIYNIFKILSPKEQETFQNQPEIPIKLQIQPELNEGDKVQVLLDGQPYGKPTAANAFSLSIMERGTHTVSAQLLNKQGRVIRKTKTINFYVKRHSRLLGPRGN